MGCKCEKIEKLCRELDYLDEISTMACQLTQKHNDLGGELDKIAKAIPATLNVPDEKKLCNDVSGLNKDTAVGLKNFYQHTEMAIDKVNKLLTKAIKEDEAYHKTHKNVRVKEVKASMSQVAFANMVDMRTSVM